MNRKRNLVIVLVILLFLVGCAGKQTTTTTQPSPEAVAFRAITMAFDAYDMGMFTLRTLQQSPNHIITTAQYESIKTKVAWPLYRAIVAAEAAAEKYAAAPAADKDSLYEKLLQALLAITNSQKEFMQVIQSLQGGK